MKTNILIGFLFLTFSNCELTRQSDDVLKREKIHIEAHRGVTEGQKYHNTKEGILNAIKNGVEAFETDVQLTKDKKLVLIHDFGLGIYNCEFITIPLVTKASEYTYEELQKCKTNEGGYKIPLLDEIMNITKGKIFMNLEIKDDNEEIWDYIQDLIEKHEYFNQISICGFNHKYYEKVEKYNKDYNRKIVFGFLYNQFNNIQKIFAGANRSNHQISINADFIKKNPEIVEIAHNNNMAVGLWFFKEPKEYYNLFDLGIDVIITDYPIKVAKQLEKYISDNSDNIYSNNSNTYLEGCKSVEKNYNVKLLSCTSCKNGYELVFKKDQNRTLCKLKYEIIPDLYIKNNSTNIYYEKNIFAIKMLMSPIQNETLCQKNGRIIFYFEWLFDLYGYDYSYSITPIKKFILDKEKTINSSEYSLLTDEHIKKLNFNGIQIYINGNLINPEDFLCTDLFSTNYLYMYTVMGAHCYIIYKGEPKTSYSGEFRLFDDNYLSFVTYDDKFLVDMDSWGKAAYLYFYNNSIKAPICDKLKDPFQCFDKIENCLYCGEENTCKKCNDGFSLINGECLPSKDYQNNLKYYTPDNGINYYTCFSKIKNCEECYYDYFSFNNFHCTKCLNEFNLYENYECSINQQREEDSSETLMKKKIFLREYLLLFLLFYIL